MRKIADVAKSAGLSSETVGLETDAADWDPRSSETVSKPRNGGPNANRQIESRRRRRRTRHRRRRKRPLYRALLIATVVLIVAGAILVVTGVTGEMSARDSLSRAEAALTAARDDLTSLLKPDNAEGVTASLREASDELNAARVAMDRSPGLRVGRYLPGIGPVIQSIDDVITVSAAITDAGITVLDGVGKGGSTTSTSFMSIEDGRVVTRFPPELDRTLNDAVSRLEQAEPAVAALESGDAWRFQDQVLAVVDAYDDVNDALTKAAAGVSLLPAVLGQTGPRNYLLALKNNSELRADGGMVLSYGILSVDDGRIDVGEIDSVGNLVLSKDVVDSGIPDWYLKNFRNFKSLQLPQNVNLTAHFPTSAAVLARIYKENTGATVDGVIAIDPLAFESILSETGPVQVGEYEIDAGNVVAFSLNEIYDLETDPDVDTDAIIAETAEAVTERLLAGGWDEQAMAAALASAAAQGHIQLWMANPGEEERIDEIGIGGTFAVSGGDYLRPALQNFAATKLDYLAERRIRHDVQLLPDGGAIVNTTFTFTNASSEDQPNYVRGTKDGETRVYFPERAVGDQQIRVGIYVPRNAHLLNVTPPTDTVLAQREDSVLALSSMFWVGSGETVATNFEYSIASFPLDWRLGEFEIVLQPQALVRPDVVEVIVRTPDGLLVEGENMFTQVLELRETTTLELAITEAG